MTSVVSTSELRIKIPADSGPEKLKTASDLIMRGFGKSAEQSAWLMMLVDDSQMINIDICNEVIDLYKCRASDELEKTAAMWSIWYSTYYD